MFKDLKENTSTTKREMKVIRKNQVELKGLKNTIFEIEILMGEPDIILDAAEQVIIEHVAR